MSKMYTLSDPRRTIDACRLNDVIHVTTLVSRQLRTCCGLNVDRDDLLILRQRPKDISCPKCKELYEAQEV